MVTESILDSIKNMLGINEGDTNFDGELIIYINGALMIMSQLGVGTDGYLISGRDDTWQNFMGDREDLELVKSAVYLRVRLIFDPPQNSFLVDAINKQIAEYDWRIEINHKPAEVENG